MSQQKTSLNYNNLNDLFSNLLDGPEIILKTENFNNVLIDKANSMFIEMESFIKQLDVEKLN